MLKLIDVCSYFIAVQPKGCDERIGYNKLAALSYYAQGFHLAMYGAPLFEEPIYPNEAGPFMGANVQPLLALKTITINYDLYPKEVQMLLDETMEVYGQFSAWKLAEMIWNEPTRDILDLEYECYTDESLAIYFSTIIAQGMVMA